MLGGLIATEAPNQVAAAPKPKKSRLHHAFVALTVASVLVPVLTIGLLAAAVLYLPVPTALPKQRPGIDSRITRVYDKDGVEMTVLHRFDTTVPVTRHDIPRVLKQAVVAVEDRRFYSHRGVDTKGVLRALWKDSNEAAYVQGGSTITQQYVRLLYTGNQKSLERKLKEAMLARRVDRELSKDEILYRYLSRVYFGGGAYGVGAAAESYFRKSVRDLTLSEAAMLAGIIPAPSRYDPRGNPAGADNQRRLALHKMLEQKRITQAQYAEELPKRVVPLDEAVAGAPATVVQPPRVYDTRYPYFSDYVTRYLVARYGEDKVYGGGLRVETSLDPVLQAKAEEAVANALKGTKPPLEMALVSLEPGTGLVRAMVGGRDFTKSQVNLALGNCTPKTAAAPGAPTQPPSEGDGPVCIGGGGGGRQPGSSFKPFTLARALESGVSPDKIYNGPAAYRYPNCTETVKGECTVHNVESGRGGRMTLRQATAYSVNTVYAQLIQDVGVKETAETAHRLGLTMVNPEGKLPNGGSYGPSLTLGAAEVSPLDMAAAYSVFANRGLQLPATPVAKVIDSDGRVLEDRSTRAPKRVLPEPVADTVTQVLQGVVNQGTGRRADIGRPGGTAGKTGTSESYSDAWFVGYTPQLSTAVWMGYSDSRRSLIGIKGLSRVYGGTIPAQTWHDYMAAALDGVPPVQFAEPARAAPPPPENSPYTVPGAILVYPEPDQGDYVVVQPPAVAIPPVVGMPPVVIPPLPIPIVPWNPLPPGFAGGAPVPAGSSPP